MSTTRSSDAGVQVSGVTTIGIPVTDQDRAVKFYVGVLGLEKRLDVPMPGGGRWIVVAPQASTGTTLAALLLPAIRKVQFATARTDRRIAALRCVEADRLHAAARRGRRGAQRLAL